MAGLYIHVPFRYAQRAYDDAAYAVSDAPDAERFVAALRRELRLVAQPYAAEEAVTTIYVGGGRPSLLPSPTMHAIRRALTDALSLSEVEEATLELNPADATPSRLRTLKRLGITRLSLAVLSFSPDVLRTLDAPHTASEARQAVQKTREAGVETYSVDLLFGTAQQSLDTWTATLRRAVDLEVPHITLLEAPGDSSDAEARADQLEAAMALLRSEGYEQYELTHFARPGHRSAHQETYYAHGNYLGLGPSAASFWWPERSSLHSARRWTNVADEDRYFARLRQPSAPVAHQESLSPTALAQEYVFLRLRTDEGLDLNHLAARYDTDLRATKAALLDRLRTNGLIHDVPDRVRLTPRGRLLTDAITKKLLPK